MKKFIAAIDGLRYSPSSVEYASVLARQAKAHLVGVSLEDIGYRSYPLSEVVHKNRLDEKEMRLKDDQDREKRKAAKDQFEKSCQEAGINYSIHRDRNVALNELLQESVYADLLVIDKGETMVRFDEKYPSRFLRDMLAEVQCPVLVTPGSYQAIQRILFLYDGDPSSVFAIKMLSYVLPVFDDLPKEVLTVKNEKASFHLPDNTLMKEYMKRHYPEAEYHVVKGIPEEEIVRYVKSQSANTLVVTGAYRRGMVSRWFRESMADTLMRETSQPLFIAHNR